MPESGQQSEETGESKELEQNEKTDEPKKPPGWVEWVKKHPAIVGTALYVYVSFLGSTYYWMYLRRFDINFFDFAEANDFLTGALRNPWILMVGLAGVGLFALFVKELGSAWLGTHASHD